MDPEDLRKALGFLGYSMTQGKTGHSQHILLDEHGNFKAKTTVPSTFINHHLLSRICKQVNKTKDQLERASRKIKEDDVPEEVRSEGENEAVATAGPSGEHKQRKAKKEKIKEREKNISEKKRQREKHPK